MTYFSEIETTDYRNPRRRDRHSSFQKRCNLLARKVKRAANSLKVLLTGVIFTSCASKANLISKLEASVYAPGTFSSTQFKGEDHNFYSLSTGYCPTKLWSCLSAGFVYGQGRIQATDTEVVSYKRTFAGTKLAWDLLPQGASLEKMTAVALPMFRLSSSIGGMDQTGKADKTTLSDSQAHQSGYGTLTAFEGGLYVRILGLGMTISAGQAYLYEKLSLLNVTSSGLIISVGLQFPLTTLYSK